MLGMPGTAGLGTADRGMQAAAMRQWHEDRRSALIEPSLPRSPISSAAPAAKTKPGLGFPGNGTVIPEPKALSVLK